jgi:hypothetical protein
LRSRSPRRPAATKDGGLNGRDGTAVADFFASNFVHMREAWSQFAVVKVDGLVASVIAYSRAARAPAKRTLAFAFA